MTVHRLFLLPLTGFNRRQEVRLVGSEEGRQLGMCEMVTQRKGRGPGLGKAGLVSSSACELTMAPDTVCHAGQWLLRPQPCQSVRSLQVHLCPGPFGAPWAGSRLCIRALLVWLGSCPLDSSSLSWKGISKHQPGVERWTVDVNLAEFSIFSFFIKNRSTKIK